MTSPTRRSASAAAGRVGAMGWIAMAVLLGQGVRSLRPGRPAAVPTGVRDPSRAHPGRVGSASVLEVRLLGGLSAVVDGRPVELPADARARELLARLALSPGRHPRSALAGRLR